MASEQDRNQSSTESDISKAQSQQQPPQGQSTGQREAGERDQYETGEQRQPELDQERSGSLNESVEGDTMAQQRTDIEGAAGQSPTSESQSGFVGAKGAKDSSSELVDEQQFDKGGQGASDRE